MTSLMSRGTESGTDSSAATTSAALRLAGTPALGTIDRLSTVTSPPRADVSEERRDAGGTNKRARTWERPFGGAGGAEAALRDVAISK